MTAFTSDHVDRFLAHHWLYRPVDATFMGDHAHDHRLPLVGPGVSAAERVANAELRAEVAATDEPADLGLRLDRRMILSELAVQEATAQRRPRHLNPAWITGEAAFAIIGLLLPQSLPVRHHALIARLAAIPAFLADAAAGLAGQGVPSGWSARAVRECAAMALFLREDIRLHQEYRSHWDRPAIAAAEAFDAFATRLAGLPDADPACGPDHLAFLFRVQHGLDITPEQAADQAARTYDALGADMAAMAARIDPARSADDILAALADDHPSTPEAAFASYEAIDHAARAAAPGLVTVAQGYDLTYRWMAPCFRRLSQTLYFLFYRSPPGLDAGGGSTYWITPPGDDLAAFLRANNTATVKTIHSVHHGGVGHHTQNARARAAASRLARIAGTDGALGLAFLGSITLIEGWACYVEDLLIEAPGFYSDAELLLLKHYERRNAASVLVDVNLHLGRWTMDQAMDFYRSAGFAPARIAGEVVRNSMFPGSRAMYWLGVEGIRALRRRWTGDTQAFHDRLLSYGHMPLAWIADEMEHAGCLTP